MCIIIAFYRRGANSVQGSVNFRLSANWLKVTSPSEGHGQVLDPGIPALIPSSYTPLSENTPRWLCVQHDRCTLGQQGNYGRSTWSLALKGQSEKSWHLTETVLCVSSRFPAELTLWTMVSWTHMLANSHCGCTSALSLCFPYEGSWGMQEAYTLTLHIKVRRKTVISKSVKSWEILVCRSKIWEAKITLQEKDIVGCWKMGQTSPRDVTFPL